MTITADMLRERLAALVEEERIGFLNLGKAMGAKEEVERLIKTAEAVAAETASAQPEGEDDAPET